MGWASRENLHGYSFETDGRFEQLHHRLIHIYVAAAIPDADPGIVHIWETLTTSFTRVFGKELGGVYDRAGRGVCLGLKLASGEVTRFSQLSTGELEFLSLLVDLLEDSDIDLVLIDELDVHFHPDLQARVLDEIEPLCQDRFVLATVHSPILMLAARPGHLYYMTRASEVAQGQNQITRVTDDIKLLDKLATMYGGFASDVRFLKHFEAAANAELLRYAHECTLESEVVGLERSGDSDSQIAALRGILRDLPDGSRIAEIGAGKGRMLAAFRPLMTADPARVGTFEYVAVDADAECESSVREAYDQLGLRFADLQFRVGLADYSPVDLTIIANVLHEIPPIDLARQLSHWLSLSKPGGKVLILEALELAVGETSFVVFDVSALCALLERLQQEEAIELRQAQPYSHAGTPLLEAVLSITDPPAARINDSDVRNALRAVAADTAKLHAEFLSEHQALSPRSLAFRCHNLANALAFQRLLEETALREVN